MLILPLLVLGWLSLFAAAKLLPETEGCVTIVYTAVGFISFSGSRDVGRWQTTCLNPLKVVSIYAASEVFCDEGERVAGLASLDDLCRRYVDAALLPREQFAVNLTEDAIREMRVVEYLEIPNSEPVESPVLISERYYGQVSRTLVSGAESRE